MSAARDIDVEKAQRSHAGLEVNDSSSRDLHSGPGAGGSYKQGGALTQHITPGGHPVDNSQPAFPVYHRKLGNPSPLGLLSFAITTFTLSMYNASFRGITVPNVILGLALGVGGLGEIIAGIQEFVVGNTFGATAFVIYGGFWFSLGAVYMPGLGIIDAYGTNVEELNSALGLYLVAWAIITIIFTLTILKSSVSLLGLFVFLDITFWLLAAGYLAPSTGAIKAGGAFGIASAACGAYTALAAMLTPDTSYFMLPVGDLSRSS